MLLHFMDNIAHATTRRDASEQARPHLVNYFIAQGYGEQHYTEAEIREILNQLDAVGILFPWGGKNKLINLYCKWRDKQYNYWFKQWWRRRCRQEE